MFTTVAMKRGAVALLVASALAGAAEAQTVPPDARRTCACAGGAFTLPTGGAASFHVALDDYSSKPATLVVMRFIDQQGVVVKSKTVNIVRGGSATLEHRVPGVYRTRVDALESSSTYPVEGTNLRASLEVSYDATPSDGSDYIRFIGPPIWIPCDVLIVQ